MILKPTIIYPHNGYSIDIKYGTVALIGSTFFDFDVSHKSSIWQIARDKYFLNIIKEEITNINLTSFYFNPLDFNIFNNQNVYWRVKYINENDEESEWSDTHQIKYVKTFEAPLVVDQPELLSPINNFDPDANRVEVTLTSSLFRSVPPSEHIASIWQLSRNTSFTDIVLNTGRIANLTSFLFKPLENNVENTDTIHWRVKYVSAANFESLWSNYRTINFTELVLDISRPVLSSPVDNFGPDVRDGNITLVASTYISDPTSTHISSHWQVSKYSNFSVLLIDETSTGSLYQYTLNVGTLTNGESIFWRVKYIGQLDDSSQGESEWSNSRIINFVEAPLIINTPTLIAPSNGATPDVANGSTTLQSSAYSSNYPSTHGSSHWMVARDSGFSDIAWQETSTSSLTSISFNPSGNGVSNGQMIYWRVKHISSTGIESNFASPYSIAYTAYVPPPPPPPPPANFSMSPTYVSVWSQPDRIIAINFTISGSPVYPIYFWGQSNAIQTGPYNWVGSYPAWNSTLALPSPYTTFSIMVQLDIQTGITYCSGTATAISDNGNGSRVDSPFSIKVWYDNNSNIIVEFV